MKDKVVSVSTRNEVLSNFALHYHMNLRYLNWKLIGIICSRQISAELFLKFGFFLNKLIKQLCKNAISCLAKSSSALCFISHIKAKKNI